MQGEPVRPITNGTHSSHTDVASLLARDRKRKRAATQIATHLPAMSNPSRLWSFLDPKKNWLTAMHMKSVSNRLRKYGLPFSPYLLPLQSKLHRPSVLTFVLLIELGLRYDDLYDPMYDLDIKEALNRLPRPVIDARNQRHKRAMDLSMKHLYLPEDLQVIIILLPFLLAKLFVVSVLPVKLVQGQPPIAFSFLAMFLFF